MQPSGLLLEIVPSIVSDPIVEQIDRTLAENQANFRENSLQNVKYLLFSKHFHQVPKLV